MAANYTIDTITETRTFTPGRPSVPAHEIAFTTVPSGIVGTVTIDDNMFTEENVAQVVAARAAVLERIKAQ